MEGKIIEKTATKFEIIRLAKDWKGLLDHINNLKKAAFAYHKTYNNSPGHEYSYISLGLQKDEYIDEVERVIQMKIDYYGNCEYKLVTVVADEVSEVA